RPDPERRPEEHVDLHAVQCQFHGLMTLLVQVSHQIDGMLACVSEIMATTPGGAEYIGQIDTARDAVARAYDQLQRTAAPARRILLERRGRRGEW
ncbi:hypothetical protein, partial [Rhodoplanes sp. SY1]|uniref:hypothetical protein n=1 Tax=Rhodoplanes sp. SY1 TaxID=3166646 RepID=UPI0038B5B3DF